MILNLVLAGRISSDDTPIILPLARPFSFARDTHVTLAQFQMPRFLPLSRLNIMEREFLVAPPKLCVSDRDRKEFKSSSIEIVFSKRISSWIVIFPWFIIRSYRWIFLYFRTVKTLQNDSQFPAGRKSLSFHWNRIIWNHVTFIFFILFGIYYCFSKMIF